MTRRIPSKLELLQMQKLYRTDKRIAQAMGHGVSESLVAYWRRKKGIGRTVFPKYSLMEIKELWERFGDDQKAGSELGVTKQAFYRWRKKYKLLEKPAILKLEQLELKFYDEPRRTRAAGQTAMTMLQRIVAAHGNGQSASIGHQVTTPVDLVVRATPEGLAVCDYRSSSEGNGGATLAFSDFDSMFAGGLFRPGQIVLADAPAVTALAVTGSIVIVDATRAADSGNQPALCALSIDPALKITIAGTLQTKQTPFDSAVRIYLALRPLLEQHFCVELCGAGVERLTLHDRMALLTYVRLLTGKHTFLHPDQTYLSYLTQYRVTNAPVPFSDRQVYYLEEINVTVAKEKAAVFNLGGSGFLRDSSELGGHSLALVRIGPHLGGSLDDFKIVASALGSEPIRDGVQLCVWPRSRQVFLEAMRRKYVQKIVEAGGIVASSPTALKPPPLRSGQFELTTEVDRSDPSSLLASTSTIMPIMMAGKITKRNLDPL